MSKETGKQENVSAGYRDVVGQKWVPTWCGEGIYLDTALANEYTPTPKRRGRCRARCQSLTVRLGTVTVIK
jgi:hypothetical protein